MNTATLDRPTTEKIDPLEDIFRDDPISAAERRVKFVAGLRELADFYDANPDMPAPWSEISLMICVTSKAEMIGLRSLLGKVEKTFSGNYADIKRAFGSLVIDVFTARGNVCKAIEKTVTVEEDVAVEFEAQIQQVPVRFEKRQVEKTVTEWDCGSLLG